MKKFKAQWVPRTKQQKSCKHDEIKLHKLIHDDKGRPVRICNCGLTLTRVISVNGEKI